MDENKIVSDNMGLVYKQLHKFGLAYDDDALSYGMEALLKAARTYSDENGASFSTYASACIYNSVAGLLRRKSKKRVLDTVSYDAPLKEYEGTYLSDVIADPDTIEDYFDKKEKLECLDVAFKVVYDKLNDTAKAVIDEWRNADYHINQVALAEKLGVSQPHVSRTIIVFKHNLKKEMEKRL